MPLESANTIQDLDNRWPLGTDSATRGDDHLRLIKSVLKKQFPGRNNQGWDKPLTIDVDDLNNIFKLMKPVGTVEFRMDDINPGTLYGGTWVLIDHDATITFGDGTPQSGAPTGSNTVDVPLLKHTHTATFKGDPLPTHDHSIPTEPDGSGGRGSVSTGPHAPVSNTFKTNGVSAGTPEGTVTVAEAGDAAPKINVRGAQVAINVWRKTKD